MKRTLFVFASVAAAFFAVGAAPAAPGPLDLSGSLGGANYAIKVPASWNGTLVLLAHGYRDKADHPGEVDQTAALDAGFAGIAAGLNAQGHQVLGNSIRLLVQFFVTEASPIKDH